LLHGIFVLFAYQLMINKQLRRVIMTKGKKILLASALSVLTFGGFAAYAGSGENCGFSKHGFAMSGMHSEKRAEMMVKRMQNRLNLTAVQVSNLEAVQQLFAKYHQDKAADGKGALLSLLDAPSLDQAEALHLLQSRGEARKAQAPVMIAAMATFTDSLNNEQRAKLKKTLTHLSHRGGFGKRHNNE
jgi:Spy/CpxP family protein refolding chaperone